MSTMDDLELDLTHADIREHRGWFIGLGVLFVALGITAMVAAFAATLATVLLFGALLLAAGIIQIAHTVWAARWRGYLTQLLAGILYAGIGGLMVFDPVAGAIGLTLLLAVFFVVGGLLKIVLGVQAESGWFALSGFVNLLLGLLIAVGWPATGTWVIGLFLGIELVLAGLSLILVASAELPPVQMNP